MVVVFASSPELITTLTVVCFFTFFPSAGSWLMIFPFSTVSEGAVDLWIPRSYLFSSFWASSYVLPVTSGTFTISESVCCVVVPFPPLNTPTAFPTRNMIKSAITTPATTIRIFMIFFVSLFTSFFLRRSS